MIWFHGTDTAMSRSKGSARPGPELSRTAAPVAARNDLLNELGPRFSEGEAFYKREKSKSGATGDAGRGRSCSQRRYLGGVRRLKRAIGSQSGVRFFSPRLKPIPTLLD